MLWNRSLVMLDQETRSLWSHILGEAMDGDLKGERLESIASTMMDWKSWKEAHPKTTVMALGRTSKEYRLEFQKKPNTFVLGLVHDGDTIAYPFDLLAKRQVVNDVAGRVAVVVTFDSASTAGQIFSRAVDGKALTFKAGEQGRMTDAQTGSVWHAVRGACESGELKGKQLEPIPANISYRKTWATFHPDGRTFGED